MFNVDSKVRAQLATRLQRVLLVDPHLGTIHLLNDLFKALGVAERAAASSTEKAFETATELGPQLILTEVAGPNLNGLDLVARLRRSTLECRQAPIIVLSADATAASIKGARDAGAHEFLCKPFTAGALFKRVENVILKPRPWIEATMYVGPDRRRFNSGEFEGDKKRRADAAGVAA